VSSVAAGAASTLAVSFRRGDTVWIGALKTSTPYAANGDLWRAASLGASIGSPSIAANGDTTIVVWADRATASDPWGLRWVRFANAARPGEPVSFLPPAGGKGENAMSPGITALSDGRFLLVWTEGPASGHEVRALTLTPEGQPIGAPLAISGDGSNAGQGQAAVNAAGRGVVGFLRSRGATFEVAATSIVCF
jgi:hypothetical protein